MKHDNFLYKMSGRFLVYLYAIFLLLPMYFIVITSFKSGSEVSSNPLGFPGVPVFGNFAEAFVKGEMARCGLNSIIITVTAVILALLNCTIITYGIFKLFNRKIGVVIYSIIMGSMLIPGVGLVAMIQLYQKLHLYNNLLGPILASSVASLPFNVFILLGFLRSLPKDLLDAATIDGCTDMQNLFYIIVPVVKPAITTLGIFAFVTTWNNLLIPLVLLRDPKLYTIPIGLFAFRGTYTVQYNFLFAAIFIAGAPLVILYLKFQKNFVEALAGSIKG